MSVGCTCNYGTKPLPDCLEGATERCGCHGERRCLATGTWDYCGEKGPFPELCNGLDDDCNGKIDDAAPRSCGQCQDDLGFTICRDGVEVCLSARSPSPELCNKKDDDCNGTVDDLPGWVPCYSGPLNTAGVGSCHPGFLTCDRGVEHCAWEVTPTTPSCHTGEDADCNGLADDGETDPLEIVFFIDTSYSMAPWIATIKASIRSAVRGTGARYAIVSVPGPSLHCELFSNLVGAADLPIESVELLAQAYAEPTWDCLWLAIDHLGIHYADPPIKRFFIQFSDESGQTYLGDSVFSPPSQISEPMVAESLFNTGIRYFGFHSVDNFEDYNDLADWTGGYLSVVQSRSMALELADIIETGFCDANLP